MLTIKSIAIIAEGSTLWDNGRGSVSGFAARRQKSAAVVYALKYRTGEGRQRWHTIGRHGAPWTPDMARAEARRLLGEVAKGLDPSARKQDARRAATVADLCDLYIEGVRAAHILTPGGTPKKASTIATDEGRVRRHIVPLLGRMKVAAVTSRDIEQFRDAVAEGKTSGRFKTGKHGLARVTGGRGTATRTLALLGHIFSFAIKRGLRSDNPLHGVARHAYGSRNRRMSDAEYGALGTALHSMPATTWPLAIAAIRFLAMTGWRRGEMLSLKWEEIDLVTRSASLRDTKTGASRRPLSNAVCGMLREIPRFGDLVFPASAGEDRPMRGFNKVWCRTAAKAELPVDVTPHVMRHSFASIAVDLGFSELTIAALLGHRKASITSKYAHHADAVLLQAADKVADRIAELMGGVRESGAAARLRRDGQV